MSDCDDCRALEVRVRRLEAWRRQVIGPREPKAPEPSRIEKAMAACRAVGVSEAELEALVAPLRGGDPEALAGALEERAERDDLRARARRGGIEFDDEERA